MLTTSGSGNHYTGDRSVSRTTQVERWEHCGNHYTGDGSVRNTPQRGNDDYGSSSSQYTRITTSDTSSSGNHTTIRPRWENITSSAEPPGYDFPSFPLWVVPLTLYNFPSGLYDLRSCHQYNDYHTHL